MKELKKIEKMHLTKDQLSKLKGGVFANPGISLWGANKNKAEGCSCDKTGNNDNNKNKAYECGCEG